MQVVILAGGLGTRMLPRTEKIPKFLLPVAGRPFAAWQLERIAACGFQEAILCVGHLADAIRREAAGFTPRGLSIRIIEDGDRLLGTAGAIRKAFECLEPTFLVTYGDSYLPFDYAAPLRDLDEHPEAEGTMAVFRNAGAFDRSNTTVRGDIVLSYDKRAAPSPEIDHIDYGATALRRDVIARLADSEVADLSTIQHDLAARGLLRAFRATQRFYEIGSESGFAELEALLIPSPR